MIRINLLQPLDTHQTASETYRTNQSGNRDRADQWRQAFRGSLSTSCVTYHQSDEIPSPTQLTKAAFTSDEKQRLPRQLPAQPLRKSSVNLRDALSTPGGYCLSEHGYSGGLRPPQITQVHRASSFDGRLRHTGVSEIHSSPVCNRPRRTNSSLISSTANTPPTSFSPLTSVERERSSPTFTQRSDLSGLRERLAIAPSIEISLAGDCSSSSEEDQVEPIYQNLKNPGESRRPSSQVITRSPSETHPDNLISGSRALPKAPSQMTPQGRGSPDQTHSTRMLNRPKLTRQPRSFQAEPFGNQLQSVDIRGSSPLMDEFEYFCQIANSPSGSRDKGHSLSSHQSGSLSPSRHHLAAMRSHSMRTTSPETPPTDNRPPNPVNSRSNRTYTEMPKPAYLRPPARGQLRRASTEEEQFKQPVKDRTPVSATLSYSPVNVSVQNVCRSPPKSVPQLPALHPPMEPSQDAPIGVPITDDSLFADEPGMTFYQVQVLGAIGVGKTSLCQQLSRLKTGSSEIHDLDDEENRPASHSVTAALRGSVYTVNFIDTSAESFEENLEIQIHDCVDAFIVMYAIDDSSSYEAANLIMNALSPPMESACYVPRITTKSLNNQFVNPALIYLVANKTDLVRGRQVSTEEGRHLANVHDAKFIEVSASLNHLVADLFVLLVTHLRESEQRGRDPRLPTERRTGYTYSSVNTGTIPGIPKAGTQGSNTFRIPSSTKSTLTRFFKKHFTKNSEESE
ncbi:GTP-binding protein GEM [Fasciola gigantica]|uniref:GTP-binding protein GEM n=1 Tax=Fasciola gigantica TaxID=46835 RepID=A0A504YND7_FASGI|nr:GTP-binding protein GEM [Fasciola gigantica]